MNLNIDSNRQKRLINHIKNIQKDEKKIIDLRINKKIILSNE